MTGRKIFVIGMFKTGITSISDALRMMGFQIFKGPWWEEKEIPIDNWNEKHINWTRYKFQIENKCKNFDAFSDYPFMFIYPQLYMWFSESYFIYTERCVRDVIKSTMNQMKMSMSNLSMVNKIKQRYEYHQQEVYSFFNDKNNFLVISLKDSDKVKWLKLNKFLYFSSNKCQNFPFPHSNKGKYK